VERALNELGGIQSINVNLAEKKVTVDYNESKVTTEAIKNAIEEIGYDVE
jgi:copper chaperone CopZ